ncbi:Oxygen-regulated invasion protein OrgB [Pandoraea horticolens]|uniref:Oxygen-regulated invasion protein OrgB n=1 Tax=Pandoraea horticolens TaxID=2508298 RepID=A0A5E4XLJ9_9BURK|nr:HrpE/YscL family type III secretion apparatus protein [Pandoraea horticolens]VVE37153.1 Oxygen-regulated invasion protein OrgB [Pandoraea horticolens]
MPFTNLRQHSKVPASGGVLIRRASLARAVDADNLMHEARRRACSLIREADRQADACLAHGARRGYEAGFRLALSQLAEYFARCRQRQLALRDRLVDELTQTLRSYLGDPELLLRLTQAFADHQGETAPHLPWRVWLPESARCILPDLRQLLAQAAPSAQVACTDTPSFIIEWGDEVMEFDPGDAAENITERVHQACRDAALSMDETTLARDVLLEALERVDSNNPARMTSTDFEGAPSDDNVEH